MVDAGFALRDMELGVLPHRFKPAFRVGSKPERTPLPLSRTLKYTLCDPRLFACRDQADETTKGEIHHHASIIHACARYV